MSALPNRVATFPAARLRLAWSSLIATAVAVLAPMTGTAEASFGPPFDLSAPGQQAFAPQTALDSDGNAHFVWQGFDGTNYIVQTRRRAADGTLGAVQDLSAAGQGAHDPQVAVDTSGNAHFVWQRSDGTNQIVQTRRRAADGTLGAVQDLSAAGQDAGHSQVAVDAAGNAHIVWQRSPGTNDIVQTRRRAADGTLGAVQDLSAAGQDARPQVAIDASGNAHFVWEHSDIETRRRAPDGTLGPVQQVASGADEHNGTHEGNGEPCDDVVTVSGHQVAVDAAGNADFIWKRFLSYDDSRGCLGSGTGPSGAVTLHTRRRAAGGALGAAETLDGGGNVFPGEPQVATDPSGNAHLVWTRFDEGSNTWTIRTRRRDAAGTLGAAQTLSSAGQDVREPQVALDASGNAHFVWDTFDASSFSPIGAQARRRRADGTLEAVQDLATADADGVTIDALGNAAAAVWFRNGIVQGAVLESTPVIFVHGFLASTLRCATGSGDAELWPNIPSPRLGAMELASDGVTDAGDGTCSGPVLPDGVVESIAGVADIHGSTLQFLDRVAPGARYVYDWDWRKSPQQALSGLDALVDQVRTAHGGRKVAILAHSFGGLVTRWYIDDPGRAAKVERALIVGTPSWGAPKSLFPLATGQETPALSTLDPILGDNALKSFARNLTGDYFLYPSANYGTWLTVHGRVPSVLDEPHEMVDYVDDDLVGNGTLLQQAFDAHMNVLDGWESNGVDVRALVGTGMNTVVGVDLLPGAGTFQPDAAELRFGNGDETVPARSAVQGTPGTSNPLGEDIPIHYACGVSHVPLAGDAALTAAGAGEFLASGEALTAPAQPCSNGGFSIQVHDVELTLAASSRAARNVFSTSAGVQTAAQSLTDAEAAGQIDLIRFPTMAVAATNDANPVDLEIPSATARVVVRRLDGESEGTAQSFGPFPDGIMLTTSETGAIEVGPIPAAGGEPSPDPSGSGGSGGPGPAPPSVGDGGGDSAGAFAGLRLRSQSVAVRNAIARITAACDPAAVGACDGAITLTASIPRRRAGASGRRRKPVRLGRARFTLQPGQSAKVRVKIAKAGLKLLRRGKPLKATATAVTTDRSGARTTTTARVTLKQAKKRRR